MDSVIVGERDCEGQLVEVRVEHALDDDERDSLGVPDKDGDVLRERDVVPHALPLVVAVAVPACERDVVMRGDAEGECVVVDDNEPHRVADPQLDPDAEGERVPEDDGVTDPDTDGDRDVHADAELDPVADDELVLDGEVDGDMV